MDAQGAAKNRVRRLINQRIGGNQWLAVEVAIQGVLNSYAVRGLPASTPILPILAEQGVTLDPMNGRVSARGGSVELTTRQMQLLAYLMAKPGTLTDGETMRLEIWGHGYETVNVYTTMHQLRGRLGNIGAGKVIQSKPGKGGGYRFGDAIDVTQA